MDRLSKNTRIVWHRGKEMKKPIIQNRNYKAQFSGEFSSMDYHIIASREIIQEIDDAFRKIENKYKKRWESRGK